MESFIINVSSIAAYFSKYLAFNQQNGLLILVACLLLTCGLQAWRAKRYVVAGTLVLIYTATVLYLNALLDRMSGFGSDTYIEMGSFVLTEAKAYFYLFFSSLPPVTPSQFVAVLVSSVIFAGCYLLLSACFTARYRFIITISPSVILAYLVVINAAELQLKIEKNSADYAQISSNFSQDADLVSLSPEQPRDLDVYVYIGESTSAFNMSLYGYARDTNPRLRKRQKLGDLIVLKNVYANYTHTSPSLLDTLSFPLSVSDEPVWQQPRISIVDVLKHKSVSVAWLSNQNRTGSANYASTILTRAADFKKWSRDFSIVPNATDFGPRVFDHDFIEEALAATEAAYTTTDVNVSRVTFIHSYAGHDPYLEMIPAAHRVIIDSTLSQSVNPVALLGKVYNGQYRLQEWNDYDSAVRYVDTGIDSLIDAVSRKERASVVLFFSDHGEAPMAGRRHDSSQYVLDMLAVPVLMYFNQAAQRHYPALHEKYKQSEAIVAPRTLSQISPTILDLLGIQTQEAHVEQDLSKSISTSGARVLKRNKGANKSAVSLLSLPANGYSDASDDATKALRWASTMPDNVTPCYHQSNTVAKAIRGVMALNCIEFDIVVQADDIRVNHPPDLDIALELTEFLSWLANYKTSIWIDAKNIDSFDNCQALYDVLKANEVATNFSKVLLEFPSESIDNLSLLKPCMKAFKALGFRLSYYVPTDLGLKCRDTVSESCDELFAALVMLATDTEFTDLSFDNRLATLMHSKLALQKFRFNRWGVSEATGNNEELDNYGFVIFSSYNDPNNAP